MSSARATTSSTRARGRPAGGDIHDGLSISLASRWPLGEVQNPDLNVTPRTAEFAGGTIIAEVFVPEPIGALPFVDHLPNWRLTFEHERELQTAIVGSLLAAGYGGHAWGNVAYR